MHTSHFSEHFSRIGRPTARDLADFHLRWAEFRPVALAMLDVDGLTSEQMDILGWLIALSDRVSEKDFST